MKRRHPKTVRFQFRLTESQARAFEELRDHNQQNTSDFIRYCVDSAVGLYSYEQGILRKALEKYQPHIEMGYTDEGRAYLRYVDPASAIPESDTGVQSL